MKTLDDLRRAHFSGRHGFGRQLDTRDRTPSEWRAGTLVTWAPALNAFVWQNKRVTVRPSDSLRALGAKHGGLVAVTVF